MEKEFCVAASGKDYTENRERFQKFPQTIAGRLNERLNEMKILGIDTTAGEGSVSLFAGGRPAATLTFEGGRKHSVNLFQAVEDLIRQAGCAFRDVDLISVARGPGSFTGIRVGLAAAKGWAEALGKPVVGVSVLDAMAASFSSLT